MTDSIGDLLKQAREKKGLSLDQVSQSTHIRTFYLEALESDKRSALPSNVQGRGFLRLYAGLLELPIQPLLDIWDGKPPADDLPTPNEQPAETQTASDLADSNPTLEEITDSNHLTPELDVGNDEDSASIFADIGKTLRMQREALGLSLAEVERYTRLRQHYLSALEDGKFENMPSPVQGRGMLSNYAAFLNLNEEKLLLRFAEGLQTRRVERIPKTQSGVFPNKKRIAKQAPVWKRFVTPDLIFGISLAAIILFFILWTAARIDSLRGDLEPTAPALSEILLAPESAQTSEQTTAPPAAALPTQVSPGLENIDDQGSSSTATPNLMPGSVLPTDEGQTRITATIVAMNNDPLQVYIVARQRAFLRITADDKVKFLGRLVPGNAYAFSGTQKIELLSGNAAGIQVFFNQKDLGSLGNAGEILRLLFVPEGILTPTPAFPPTATPTKMGSITPLPSPTMQNTPTVTPFVP